MTQNASHSEQGSSGSSESVGPSEEQRGQETGQLPPGKIKKQLLRGSSEKIIISNKLKKSAGDIKDLLTTTFYVFFFFI